MLRTSSGRALAPVVLSAIFCALMAPAAASYELAANKATYQGALATCRAMYNAQLVNPDDGQGLLALQSLCEGDCWVAGQVNGDQCPMLTGTGTQRHVQHALCSGYLKFACGPAATSTDSTLATDVVQAAAADIPQATLALATDNIHTTDIPQATLTVATDTAQATDIPQATLTLATTGAVQATVDIIPASVSTTKAGALLVTEDASASKLLPAQSSPTLDLSKSLYEQLPELTLVVAVHLVHIPGTDRYFYMERPSGYHPDGSHNIAGSFDLATRTWTRLDSPDGLFCCGHSVMSNGSIVVMGGHVANAGYADGRWSIRTFTDGTPGLVKVTNMQFPRWYATVTLLPDEKILVMGGTQGVGAGTAGNPYYEIWDPKVPDITQKLQVNPGYLASVKQNYYPFNYILPSGDLFNYCARTGWIMDPYTATYKVPVPARPLSNVAPAVAYVAQYPYTASSVMLPLSPENDYAVEVMIFGGQNVKANSNLNLEACSESLRLKITLPTEANPSYSFNGGWVQERMGSPRVMPDAVLLPNGAVILLNGARQGLAGDAASGGGSKAYYPNFHAEMYLPWEREGQRWSTLSRSQIPRLYHSNTALTTNGTILVAGCDRCGKVVTNDTFLASPAKADYRQEIFYPPFWFDFNSKPSIVSAPASVKYGQQFTVTYKGLQNPDVVVTSAVLMAPSSTTHSFNTNQRAVKLVIQPGAEGSDGLVKTLTLTAPPSANHAPPQLYMLFLLNGLTYSPAVWVRVSA